MKELRDFHKGETRKNEMGGNSHEMRGASGENIDGGFNLSAGEGYSDSGSSLGYGGDSPSYRSKKLSRKTDAYFDKSKTEQSI